jgi:ADP-ribose pyrophosphatase YjhB (NUDIX family)
MPHNHAMASYPESGGPIHRTIPAGDNRARLVCDACGYIQYDNPKVVVGAVAIWQDRILLCRRAIEPRTGYWTLPAGYLELNESTEDGAMREAREEAGAELRLNGILAVYNIPRISQVQIIYRAELLSDDIAAGEESQEVGLFAEADIPWQDLAFPSVRWALRQYDEIKDKASFAPFTNPDGETGDFDPDAVMGV